MVLEPFQISVEVRVFWIKRWGRRWVCFYIVRRKEKLPSLTVASSILEFDRSIWDLLSATNSCEMCWRRRNVSAKGKRASDTFGLYEVSLEDHFFLGKNLKSSCYPSLESSTASDGGGAKCHFFIAAFAGIWNLEGWIFVIISQDPSIIMQSSIFCSHSNFGGKRGSVKEEDPIFCWPG